MNKTLKYIIFILIVMMTFAGGYLFLVQEEKQTDKQNAHLTLSPDELLSKIKSHPEYQKSPRVLRNNIDDLFDTANYLLENCNKLKPTKGCFNHSHVWFVDTGDKSRALEIKTSSKIKEDKRLVQLYAECSWPDPPDRFMGSKPPKGISFPGSAYGCSYIPFNSEPTVANACRNYEGYNVSFDTPQIEISNGNTDYEFCEEKLLRIEMTFDQYPVYQMIMNLYLINE